MTVENFIRAETDVSFGVFVNRGAFGKFNHGRAIVHAPKSWRGNGISPRRIQRIDLPGARKV